MNEAVPATAEPTGAPNPLEKQTETESKSAAKRDTSIPVAAATFQRRAADYTDLTGGEAEGMPEFKSQEEVDTYIGKLESDMREAAKRFEFEKAAKLRDTIKELRTKEFLFA